MFFFPILWQETRTFGIFRETPYFILEDDKNEGQSMC